jgi:transcriptional regulator with XRE-family HTH domain
MTRVAIRPEMLRWACERARVDARDLALRIPQLPAWENGEKQPTLKQLEGFAKATHTPIGYLFLPDPPEERLPIHDLRTVLHGPVRPSADLLETIYAMQRRQDWLREKRIECEAGVLDFVGSARLSDDPAAAGQKMRRMVNADDRWAT